MSDGSKENQKTVYVKHNPSEIVKATEVSVNSAKLVFLQAPCRVLCTVASEKEKSRVYRAKLLYHRTLK